MKALLFLALVTVAAANVAIEKTCLDAPDSGMCNGYFNKWYFDSKIGECQEFIYGGCQGNRNRYDTREECESNCKGLRPKTYSTSACDLPAEPGVCNGAFLRYFYDVKTGQCVGFLYGGCGGNENNFESMEICQRTCARSIQSPCHLDKNSGRCHSYFLRYYYDRRTGECKDFVYGGCEGNANNFETKEECESVCSRRSQ